MPMVGMGRAAVICGGGFARNAFENNGPRAGMGQRKGIGLESEARRQPVRACTR